MLGITGREKLGTVNMVRRMYCLLCKQYMEIILIENEAVPPGFWEYGPQIAHTSCMEAYTAGRMDERVKNVK